MKFTRISERSTWKHHDLKKTYCDPGSPGIEGPEPHSFSPILKVMPSEGEFASVSMVSFYLR